MFKGPKGKLLAAIKIQKLYKGWKAYSNFKQLKYAMGKASVIQKAFRLYMLKKKTSGRLKEIRQDRINNWQKMQDEFKRDWKRIKNERRIEIHINSFSISEM